MGNANQYEFSEKLDSVARLFNKNIPDEAKEYYWTVAKDHPHERVMKALESVATNCKMMPRPADLREHLTLVSQGTGDWEQDEWAEKYAQWAYDKQLHPEDYPDEAWVQEWIRHTEKTLGFKLDFNPPPKRGEG